MEKILKTRRVFRGKAVTVDEVDIDFKNGRKAIFERVGFTVKTGVSALPIDEKNQVILVKHFQLGAGKSILTLPTGGLPAGEDPKKRMQLELQEEIGYRAGKLTLMLRAHAIPGYVGTTPFYVYLAQNLTPSKITGDEIEDLEVIKISFPKMLHQIKIGAIVDSRIIIAALYYDKYYNNHL